MDLAAQVLRLAARLPAAGPRGGDLTPVARLIGESVGARAVTIRECGGQNREHVWSSPDPYQQPDRPPTPGVQHTGVQHTIRPVRHRGTRVGEIAVTTLCGPPALSDVERQVDNVAAVLGVVLAAASAAGALRAARDRVRSTLGSIADARFRAASQMENQRHALERDLHDGAQLHLVSLQLACAVVEHQVETGIARPRAVQESVADLGTRLRRTRRLLMDTAAGVTPTPLRTAGLARALALSLRDAPDVTLDVAPGVSTRRYPPTVESAVYYTCLEAVSNAQKHVPDASIVVTLRDTYHGLWFSVADPGPGLGDADAARLGNLRTRLASVGGTLRVRSEAGNGTEIIGSVPI